MMADLKGKAGIVTGGSSGIGFQIANVLAEAGATVYVISRTGRPKEGVGESASGVVHLKGDVGDVEAMKAMVAELAAKHNGCLDFLVNNAGVSYKCRAENFPMEQFDNIMNVNVKYLFEMSVVCFKAIKHIGPTLTSIFGAMEPLTAVFIGIVVFHETSTISGILGMLLIIIAVFIVVVKENRK